MKYHQTVPEIILCRNCGHELTNSSSVIDVNSEKVEKIVNYTKLGNTSINIQRFTNPNGKRNLHVLFICENICDTLIRRCRSRYKILLKSHIKHLYAMILWLIRTLIHT